MFFFFNDTATTEIYTLSLHDALPILLDGPDPLVLPRVGEAEMQRDQVGVPPAPEMPPRPAAGLGGVGQGAQLRGADRKSTRLNSSHANISYAVFCLKKKKNSTNTRYN